LYEIHPGGFLKIIFDTYNPGENIPVQNFLSDKKLKKYFNRETAAAVVCAGKLFKDSAIDACIPFYYSTGILEYQDYGLEEIVKNSVADDGKFSENYFINHAVPLISPLNQFKILQNMPLSFISIIFHLNGDNAVLYSSAAGLLMHSLFSPSLGEIVIGAGKVYRDGKVESGFALITKNEISDSPFLLSNTESIEIFREWSRNQ
jgi:hypothetical protein